MPSSAIPRVRAGEERICLKKKLRAVLVPGSSFSHFFQDPSLYLLQEFWNLMNRRTASRLKSS